MDVDLQFPTLLRCCEMHWKWNQIRFSCFPPFSLRIDACFAFSLSLAFGFYFYLNRTIIWVKINATQLWKLHWKFVANDDDGCGENECGDSGSHKGPLWFDTQIHRHTHRRRKRHEHENRWRNKASRNENSWRIYWPPLKKRRQKV